MSAGIYIIFLPVIIPLALLPLLPHLSKETPPPFFTKFDLPCHFTDTPEKTRDLFTQSWTTKLQICENYTGFPILFTSIEFFRPTWGMDKTILRDS